MAYFPKKKRSLRRPRRVVRKRRGSKKPSAVVQRYVKQAIHRNVENKMRESGGLNYLVPTTYGNYQQQSIFPLTPYFEAGLSTSQNLDITQGTGVSNRVGNQIKTRSGYFKAVIYPAPYSASFNPTPQPLNVTMWVFTLKSGLTDSTGTVLSTLQSNWFKNQNGALPITNTLQDQVLVPNTDVINVKYRKTFKLGYASDTGTGVSVTNQSFANNDYRLNHVIKVNMTRFLRKAIRYVDNNAQPSTSTTWCCFTIANASNSAFASTAVPAYIQWEYKYQFEDA